MVDTGELPDSPIPVMTFQVAGEWLAVSIEQLDRIAQASRLCPVPLSRPEYLGLLDDAGQLVPVLELERTGVHRPAPLVAIVRVRSHLVGLAIQRAGRVVKRYRPHSVPEGLDALSPALQRTHPTRAESPDRKFWIINADRLWAA